MKPHIQIHTDKPEELLKALEQYQQNLKRLKVSKGGMGLLAPLEASQIRLVETENQGFNSCETFAIGIFIDSDKQSLAYWLSQADHFLKDPSFDRKEQFGIEEAAELDLADSLKRAFDIHSPPIPSPWNELCNAGLSRVDWLDLARHYIAKVKEGVSV